MKSDLHAYARLRDARIKSGKQKAALKRIAKNRADECQGDASGNPSRTCPRPAWLKGQAHPPRRGTAKPAVRPPVKNPWKPVR